MPTKTNNKKYIFTLFIFYLLLLILFLSCAVQLQAADSYSCIKKVAKENSLHCNFYLILFFISLSFYFFTLFCYHRWIKIKKK